MTNRCPKRRVAGEHPLERPIVRAERTMGCRGTEIAITAKLGDKRREIAELLKTTELEAVASEGIRT